MSDSNRLHPIIAVTLSRLREFVRQPEAVFWVYFFPVLMVVVLGIAFRSQPAEQVDIDVASGPAADRIVKALEDPQLKVHLNSDAEAMLRLRTGKTLLVVASTTPDLNGLMYRFDPSRPGALQARGLVDDKLQRSQGRKDAFQAKDVKFEEPGGRYVDFLVPGLLGMGLMGGGLWGVGFAIVDMRIRKLLKRLMATPMKRTHFLFGMMISRLVFMVPQILILLAFSYLIFGVKIYGNWGLLVIIVLFGAFEFAGIGLLVASRAKTIETVSGLMNLIMLPMWTLCGIFFSYERFPEILHPFIKWLPLTPVIDSLRAVMLDGASLTQILPELGIMTFWMLATFFLALAIFRWND